MILGNTGDTWRMSGVVVPSVSTTVGSKVNRLSYTVVQVDLDLSGVWVFEPLDVVI